MSSYSYRQLWKQRIAKEAGFPPCLVEEGESLFCSLGNGHFFQALNLTGNRCKSPGVALAIHAALAQRTHTSYPSIVLPRSTKIDPHDFAS